MKLLPTVLGTMAIPHHWPQAVFILVFLEFGAICTHSGYNIPWMPSSLQHDFHHFAFDENFGPTGYSRSNKFNERWKMEDAKFRFGRTMKKQDAWFLRIWLELKSPNAKISNWNIGMDKKNISLYIHYNKICLDNYRNKMFMNHVQQVLNTAFHSSLFYLITFQNIMITGVVGLLWQFTGCSLGSWWFHGDNAPKGIG
jgi:hypothetical protein